MDGRRGRPDRRRLGARFAGSILLALAFAASEAGAGTRRVLVLSSEPAGTPGTLLLNGILQRELLERFPRDLEIRFEQLDLVFVSSDGYQGRILDLLAAKYEDNPPEILVATGFDALRLALTTRQSLFPSAKLAFGWIDRSDLAAFDLTGVAGVVSRWEVDTSLDRALELLPRTRRAVLIVGSGPFESRYLPVFRSDLARFAGRVELDWWIGLPATELDQRVAELPQGTVILYLGAYRDNTGATLVPTRLLERLAPRSSVPIFGRFSPWMGAGIVGDASFDLSELCAQLAKVIARLLEGEPSSAVGLVELRDAAPSFDARQIERWEIPRHRLPAGSRLLFESPSLWKTHRRWIVAGVALISVQAVLLVAVGVQRLARRRAEQGERRIRGLQEAVVDSLHARVAVLDHQGRIVAVNRAWRNFLDEVSSAQFDVGGDYLAAAHAAVACGRQDAARTVEALDAVLSGRERFQELEYAGHGGKEGLWFAMTVVALGHDERGAVVEITDVTERRRVEERFRMTIESLPVAMFLIGKTGHIEMVNAQAEEIFGYSRQELVGQTIDLLVPEASRARHEQLRTASFGSSPASLMRSRREFPGRCRDGREIPVEIILQSVETSHGRVVLAAVTDRSETRRLEHEAQRMRTETAHYGRLATAGELSAAIAHELNQPLTGIVSNAQAAQTFLERGTASPEILAEMLADIAADGQRAGEVIRRLRALLRKGPLDLRPLDLNDAIAQVAGLVTQDLLLRDAALDLELSPDLPPVLGDRVHLQQVVLNLVLNGVAAMAGSPPEERRLRLRTLRAAEHTVRLEVRDTGSGIPAEVMTRLFEPFFTTKPEGMGMGLPIVRSIIESHGGTISAANNPSGGATFTVVLRAAEIARGAA